MDIFCNHRIVNAISAFCVLVLLASCGSSKPRVGARTYGDVQNTKSMRKIEKQSPRSDYDQDGTYIAPMQKKANAEKARKDAAKKKESDKTYKEALKQHREMQSEEMQERMKTHLAESNKKYSREKECFIKRWFRPSTDIDKIEKRRAKEVERRMAATRKKAERNNARRSETSFKGKKRQSRAKPDPNDTNIGGGGTYTPGKGGVNRQSPADQPSGGGGTYTPGKGGAKRQSPADQPSGGGGTYTPGKGGTKRQSVSEQTVGGGGTYTTGKGGTKRQSATEQTTGGGGSYKSSQSSGKERRSSYKEQRAAKKSRKK